MCIFKIYIEVSNRCLGSERELLLMSVLDFTIYYPGNGEIYLDQLLPSNKVTETTKQKRRNRMIRESGILRPVFAIHPEP